MAGQNVLRAFDWTGWVPGRMGVVQVVKPQYLWMGKTTSKADGTWTITLDGANFEEIMSVSATVQVPSGNLSDQCIATVKSVTTGPAGRRNKNGASKRVRTSGLRGFTPTLYQLSYTGAERVHLLRPVPRSRGGMPTPTLHGAKWWTEVVSNHRHLHFQCSALPLSYPSVSARLGTKPTTEQSVNTGLSDSWINFLPCLKRHVALNQIASQTRRLYVSKAMSFVVINTVEGHLAVPVFTVFTTRRNQSRNFISRNCSRPPHASISSQTVAPNGPSRIVFLPFRKSLVRTSLTHTRPITRGL